MSTAVETDPRMANLEMDVERAHTLALDTDKYRSLAAEQRGVLQLFHDMHTAWRNKEDFKRNRPTGDLSSSVRYQRSKASKALRTAVINAEVAYETANEASLDVFVVEMGKEDDSKFRAKYGYPGSRASRYDQKAEMREIMSGILYDNPVSTSFTEAHPHYTFTADGLATEVESSVALPIDIVALTAVHNIIDQIRSGQAG